MRNVFTARIYNNMQCGCNFWDWKEAAHMCNFQALFLKKKRRPGWGWSTREICCPFKFPFALLHKDTLQLSGSLTWYVHLTGSHSSDLSSNRMRTSLHLQRTGFLSSDISLELFHIEPGPEGQPPLEVWMVHVKLWVLYRRAVISSQLSGKHHISQNYSW